jgi:hypothetical protein
MTALNGLPLRGDENLEVRGHSPNGTLPVAATGTYTFTTNPVNTNTIVLNGTTVTFVTSGATGNHVNLGADVAATLFNLGVFLNATTDANLIAAKYNFDNTGLVLNITGATAGAAGNAFTLVTGTYGGAVSHATLTGGSDAVGGVPAVSTFTIKVSDIADLALTDDAIIDSLSGAGFVQGPASDTASGNVALFDGVTGKLIKDSGVPLLVFKTISVAGQSDVVADSGADVLTVAAGANVTITTNASTDTITIAAAGAGGAPGAILTRTDATALSAATLTANAATNQSVYVLQSATGVPITLPPATQGETLQAPFLFMSNLKPTANGIVINCVGSDKFTSTLRRVPGTQGAMYLQDATLAGNHNRMTILNGAAGTGGEVGDYVSLKCYVNGFWQVDGHLTCGDTQAVFSAF